MVYGTGILEQPLAVEERKGESFDVAYLQYLAAAGGDRKKDNKDWVAFHLYFVAVGTRRAAGGTMI
jgi:hypothetical protein